MKIKFNFAFEIYKMNLDTIFFDNIFFTLAFPYFLNNNMRS